MEFSQPRKSNTINGTFVLGKNGNGSCGTKQGGGFFFNYVYFRLQGFYKKWDGENGITAVIGVSMIQAVTLIDLCLIVLKQYYSRSETKEYSKIFGYTGVIFLTVLIIFNHFKFKDSFEKFQIIWKDETLQRRRVKGLAVFISLILPWVLLIFIGTK
jgi:hypothetical protein